MQSMSYLAMKIGVVVMAMLERRGRHQTRTVVYVLTPSLMMKIIVYDTSCGLETVFK